MKTFKIIFYNIIILFLLIIIVENTIPYLTDIKIGRERYIKTDEYQPNSNLKYLFNGEVYKKSIDENGFSVNNQINSKENKKSIYFLGSSNVETIYVKEGKRLSDLTISKLNRIYDDKFNGYNSSKGGLNTSHMLKHLIFKIIPQKPDYIFLMPTNDYSYLLEYNSYNKGPKTHFFKSNIFYFFKIIKDTFIPNIYVFLRSSIEFQIPSLGIDDDLRIKNKNKIKETQLDEFENYFRSTIKICKVFNIQTIIGTQFYNIEAVDKNKVELSKYMNSKINNIVRKVSREEGTLLLDLDSLVPKNFKYMYDAGHLNELGCDYVSDLISQKVIDLENENN
ncbi:hypothetical protein OAB54_06480 [Flavobacteriaceae bacterium]|nr:hypothetical protein [Flavobacteriaceae bacterium]